METINNAIINKMAEGIVKEVNPARIILFGSAARGELQNTSDIDLLVIEDAPFGAERSRYRETSRNSGDTIQITGNVRMCLKKYNMSNQR